MSVEVAVALIAAAAPTAAVVASIVLSRRAINELHLQLNSRLDEFLEIARTGGIAEGRLREAFDERSRTRTDRP
jgi:hypothetical protein